MTMGWHMMLGFSPALLGSYIWEENHSFEMLRRSKQCVINLPTLDLIDVVVRIGNSHGTELNKFERFGLTEKVADDVDAPLIAECYANFECRLRESCMIPKYSLFIGEISKARRRVAEAPEDDPSWGWRVHDLWRFDQRRRRFRPENL